MNNDGEKAAISKDFVKEFPECPSCGSREQFFAGIVRELKERGVVDQGWSFYLDAKQGVVFDPKKEAGLLVGSEVPGYSFATDICANCGCIYVVRLQRMTAKKGIAPVQILPNRGERRRMEREGVPPVFNNPLLS